MASKSASAPYTPLQQRSLGDDVVNEAMLAGASIAGAMPAMMAVTAPRAASAARAADRSRTPPSQQLTQGHAGSSRQHQQELNSEVEVADRAERELKADVKVDPGGIKMQH